MVLYLEITYLQIHTDNQILKIKINSNILSSNIIPYYIYSTLLVTNIRIDWVLCFLPSL